MVVRLSRSGLEVYKTTDEINNSNDSDNKKDSKKTTDTNKSKTTDTNKSTTNTSDDSENEGYVLQNGNITEISYYDGMYENEFEYDYEDISANGSVTFPYINKYKFYKGKKVCLKKAYDPKKWDDLKTVLLGFITEQTYSNDQVELEISGMTKLLDKKEKFDFKQMKRSEIVRSIIEAAGLTAYIDIGDLKDEVIDYTNISSSGSDVAGGQGEEIDSLVEQWVGGETNELEKAKKVHEGLKEYGIRYAYYFNSRYHTPQNCLKHANKPGLNCGDTAILTTACMKSAGLNAYIVLRCDHEHFFTVIKIDGTKYYSDLTWAEGQLSQRAWNDTWQNNKCGNKYDLK